MGAEIHPSALKHGIAVEDIRHAVENAMSIDDRDDDPRGTMAEKDYGKTKSGKKIDDELVGKLAAEAEAGYEVEETLRRRVGRPTLGSGPAGVESVRLDPELRSALAARAEREGEATSVVIRQALREYLKVG